MIARPEQELCPDVNRPLFIRAHVDRRVPVEAQLFLTVVGQWLDGLAIVGIAIYPANEAALRLGINVGWVRRVFEHPEAVATEHVFPARVRDATRIGGI